MSRSLVLLCFMTCSVAACRPTATISRTTPVANLQSYHTASVRVVAPPHLQKYAALLEFRTANHIRQTCHFKQAFATYESQSTPADLLVDLNIRGASRGGTGFIQNPHLAIVDVTMILSDGVDESLLGSADIQGKSSPVLIQGVQPEEQAFAAVAKRVGELLASSGCSGARIARLASSVAPEEEHSGTDNVGSDLVAQAEAANNKGKELFRNANIHGAKEQFLLAISLHQSAKYRFNLCLAHEALGEWLLAERACTTALRSAKDDRLAEKASQRLEILAEKRNQVAEAPNS